MIREEENRDSRSPNKLQMIKHYTVLDVYVGFLTPLPSSFITPAPDEYQKKELAFTCAVVHQNGEQGCIASGSPVPPF